MTFSPASLSSTRNSMTNVTYYDLLQVAPNASDEQIRTAYRRLAKHHHPDTNPVDRNLAAARFRLVQEAYDHLRDPLKRREYDQDIKTQVWFSLSPYNENKREEHASDVFSSARRTLERLMRLMANSCTTESDNTDKKQDASHV